MSTPRPAPLAQRSSPCRHARAVVQHVGDIRRVAAKMLGPTSELSDVVHETVVRALEKGGSLRDPTKLRSWLVGITVRVAREHLRSVRRFPLPLERPPPAVVCPDVDARLEVRRLLEVLDTLPSDERRAFSLRYVEGKDLRTVAEATGVSLATAKRRIRRGAYAFVGIASVDPILEHRIARGRDWCGARARASAA